MINNNRRRSRNVHVMRRRRQALSIAVNSSISRRPNLLAAHNVRHVMRCLRMRTFSSSMVRFDCILYNSDLCLQPLTSIMHRYAASNCVCIVMTIQFSKAIKWNRRVYAIFVRNMNLAAMLTTFCILQQCIVRNYLCVDKKLTSSYSLSKHYFVIKHRSRYRFVFAKKHN